MSTNESAIQWPPPANPGIFQISDGCLTAYDTIFLYEVLSDDPESDLLLLRCLLEHCDAAPAKNLREAVCVATMSAFLEFVPRRKGQIIHLSPCS